MPDENLITDSTLVENSEPLIEGVYDVEDMLDELWDMHEHGLPVGHSTGWPSFDDHYRVPRQQWSLVTGLSSSGKSTWLDNLLVNLAVNEGWKFLIASPENQPSKRHVASLMEIFTGKKFGKPSPDYPTITQKYFMTDDEFKSGTRFVKKYFNFVHPPETRFTVPGINALAMEVKTHQFNFDGWVIDPYNEIEHKRPSGMNEHEYISWVISEFREQNKRMNTHLWFVAHPTKPVRMSIKHVETEESKKPVYQKITLFDTSGAAHWKNKCDFGIIVHRDLSDNSKPAMIEIEKVRFREQGRQGVELPLYYDFLNNRYVEKMGDLLFNKLR